jgi:hypothetical protein
MHNLKAEETRDWSQEEVELIVADYFNMLDKELKGIPYNKAEHNRNLAQFLNSRSRSSIERKHQNISAILSDLGFIFINGYKPLSNYQWLLYKVVSSRVYSDLSLQELADKHTQKPAVLPEIEDILKILMDPPVSDTVNPQGVMFEIGDSAPQHRVNYFAREAQNRSLGLVGEKLVINYEKARLINERKEDLASRVEHVSLTQGDRAGFDILSFDSTGRERFIEVKTTRYSSTAPFFVTPNELSTSKRATTDYYLYRIYNFDKKARLFYKNGSLDKSFVLQPSEFMARIN